MNRTQRHAFYRKVFLAVWAMATVILAVCVVLLAKEMIDRGYQPLPMPGEDAPTFTTERVRPDAIGRAACQPVLRPSGSPGAWPWKSVSCS